MEPIESVLVSLSRDGRPSVDGIVTKLDADRVCVSIAGEGAPWIAIGEEIELFFSPKNTTFGMTTRAHMQEWSGRGGVQNYVLRFRDPEQVELELLPLLSPALNRRDSYRLRPVRAQQVPVSILPADGSEPFPAHLLDISAGGACLGLDQERDVLGPGGRLSFSIELPGRAEPLVLAAKLVYRRLAGARIAYGLQFDAASTEDFERKRNVLVRHIASWQARELRKRAG